MIRLLIFMALMLQTGCAYAPFVTQQTIDYNQTVEDATNRMLVINILRARDRGPLIFSDISMIQSQFSVKADAQGLWFFGPRWFDSNVTSGPLSISSQPTITIAPQNTKKFSSGILKPVEVKYLRHYLHARIHDKFILSLFIDHIDEASKKCRNGQMDDHWSYEQSIRGDKLYEFISDWTDSPQSQRFPPKVNTFYQTTHPFTVDGKDIVSSLDKLSKLGLPSQPSEDSHDVKDKLTFKYNLLRTVFCAARKSNSGYEALGFADLEELAPASLPDDDSYCKIEGGVIYKSTSTTCKTKKVKYIYLRSTEGMFYYLGEILKKTEEGTPPPFPFYIYKEPVSHSERGLKFTVSYEGQTYYVSYPKKEYDETISALAILNDMLNIHREADELPASKTVLPLHSN